MTSGRQSGAELAERILAEVQLAAPAALERGNSREQLRKRINKLLTDEGYPDAAPERRAVTIVQAQLHGFPALIDSHSPTAVIGMLNRYLAQMTEIIEAHGGSAERLDGEGLTVLFGSARQQHEPVAQALACAVEMQQAMTRYNQQNTALQLPPLYMGIGIHSGEVLTGTVGTHLRREHSVIGPALSMAARIAAQGLRGQVLLSEDSYRLAREFILAAEPVRLQVRGRRALLVYELLGTMRPRAMTVPRRDVRKSPRVPVQMPCYFRCVDGREVLEPLHCGQVLDLGYHGLRMVSPVPLENCGEVKMALSLQLLGARTSDIYARVVKAETDMRETVIPKTVTSEYRCSMEFVDVDLLGQQAIKQFVDSQVCGV
jgi:adenylate cyclase